MATNLAGTGKTVGAEVKRVEDPRFLYGNSKYVDDIRLPNTKAVAFLRSPYAHARIVAIDTTAAKGHPGVYDVITQEEIDGIIKPLRVEFDPQSAPTHKSCDWPVLARDKVRFVGEMVAAVIAKDRYVAEDAAALIDITYDPIESLSDMEQAMRPDAPLIHEEWGDNVMQTLDAKTGDVDKAFRTADTVVRERFMTGRHMSVPLETRGCLASYDSATGLMTVWSSTQIPHVLRSNIAIFLGFPEHRIRAVAPDVGGGFGPKGHVFPEEILISFLAQKYACPVKWIEDRSENLAASMHAKHQCVEGEIALDANGLIVGLKARFLNDVGAYSAFPFSSALEAGHSAATLPGPYKVPAYEYEAVSIVTNKVTLGAYRGVGLPIAILVMERLLNLGAEKLGLDPVEIRLKNMINTDEHPYTTIVGAEIESGSHKESLQKALRMLDYTNFRERQKNALRDNRYIGVGIASYIEGTAMGSSFWNVMGLPIGGYESATVRMNVDGKVTVLAGSSSHGQGHETTLAQVAADELGVPLTDVRIIQNDTDVVPYGWGTWGSRTAVTSGGAIIEAATKVRDKILRAASHLSEIPPQELELRNGTVSRKFDGAVVIPLKEIAYQAIVSPSNLPKQDEPGLEATANYEPPPATHSNATHIATVDVDAETGRITLLRYIVVEDCGTIINPMIVDGQIQGGVAQGIGTAIYEHAVYDESGQFLTGTLMDYLVPTAADVPSVQIGHIQTPSPLSKGGIKGMGEGGAIAPPGAIANAVSDALTPFGAQLNTIPLTPEVVLDAITRGMSK